MAFHKGHTEIAAALIAAGAKVNQAMDDGSTPLRMACQKGHTEIAAALLAAGAKVNQAADDGSTPLFIACQEGHTEVVAALIAAGAKVNQAADDGASPTPLFMACQEGHTEVVAALLAAGAKVNQADGEGWTPLIVACGNGHTEIAAALIAAGAKVDQAKDSGATPLYIACGNGHTETVAALLAAGAKVNQATDGGATPLYVACQEGHTEVVAALLAAGAKVNQAMNNGATPLFAACQHNGLLLSTVQLLSAYGASRAFVVNGTQRTAEEAAAHFGNEAVREWLAGSRQWTTPLHHLATVGADRARALLRGGADLRAAAAGADAPTPLSLAERLRAEGSTPPGSAADLVLRAAEPWSPQTHQLFPSEARAQAVELMLLGAQLSREERFEKEDDPNAGIAVWDVWMGFVVPHAVTRG
jgi:ankyrin repeat protein